jgi:hypothetical protein
MNLRCLYCQTPFTLSRVEMLTAVVNMNEKNQSHYDAHCPRCRRANSISRQRMELFMPNWREAAKQLESVPAAPASATLKTEPLPKGVKEAVLKTSSKKTTAASAKPSSSKRQRAGKPATAKKTTVSKPAAAKKTTPAKPAEKNPAKGTKSTKKK